MPRKNYLKNTKGKKYIKQSSSPTNTSITHGDGADDQNKLSLSAKKRKSQDQIVETTGKCICFVAGPASRLCPLHEMEKHSEDELEDTPNIPDNDYLTNFLENIGFNTPNSLENSVNEYVRVNDDPLPIANSATNEISDVVDNIFENIPPILDRVTGYLRAINRRSIEPYYCGQLQESCEHCNAKYFPLERNARNRYNKCCWNGKVFLPPYGQHTDELRRLFTGHHPLSKHFKAKVMTYNNLFQFASIQANLQQIPGQGPYVYAVQGQVFHHISDVNINRDQQRYGPIYFLNPEEAVRQRIGNANNIDVNPELIALIENELRRINPYSHQYRHLGQIYEQQRTNALDQEFQIPRVCLEFCDRRRDPNRREFDHPEAREVAAVVHYNETMPPTPRMRVFLTDRDSGLRIVEYQSPHSDALLFPLLFPNGDEGWNSDIPLTQTNEGRRQRVTLSQYYGYRLAWRNVENTDGHFDVFRYAGRLNQQFIVSAFLRIEANNINYIRYNQDRLRATEYSGLADYLHHRGEPESIPLGRMIILPSTYPMSPRNQMQRFQDAMAVVSRIGYPSLFITVTCNPKWPEITENLPPGDEASNHPLLVCRVFKMKLNELMTDLTKEHVMGVCIAHLYVIEFQKRGLPHAHILLTLRNEDKFRTSERIDQLISAELPDAEREPELFALVGQHMVHGPCGKYNPTSVCMDDGKCIKNFPKFWYNNTTIGDGKINYRRRNNRRTAEVRRCNVRYVVDNSFIVPYNPYLLFKYKTHINVEACVNIGTVKYLYKYFFKATDKITMEIIQGQPDHEDENLGEQRVIHYDEIKSYLSGRYLTPPECSWHILQFELHGNSHHVERLQIHLPGRHIILFRDGQEEIALNVDARSQLLGWFERNREEEFAKQWLYTEFPTHYVWRNGRWNRRQRTLKPIITRLVNVPLRNGELYYLRLLLLYVRGATCFEDLKTFNGIIYDTFREACQHRNLLSEDREWIRCLTEACARDMPKQLRQLFAFILIFGIVDDAPALWRQFRQYLIEDFISRRNLPEEEAEVATLQRIQRVLIVNGRRLSDFGLDDPPQYIEMIEDININDERREADAMIAQLNNEQRNIFDMVMRAIENSYENQRLFFVTGHAGTGKTFLYNTILAHLIAQEIKVIPVSSTGLAAALLKHGRTVHSRFQLPVPIVENSTSRISRESEDAQFIRNAKLILWDEISMATRLTFELIDRTLRFLCDDDRPFGGKCVVIGGDFKQCLPILLRGDRSDIVQASVKSSYLWNQFEKHDLTENMRVRPEEQDFTAWLDKLGNNTLPTLNNDLIQIPQECVTESLDELIQNVFGDLQAGDVPNKAILTPLNEDCHIINQRILNNIRGVESTVYVSIDSVVSDDPAVSDIYPVEFLNSLTPSGFPQYKLELKEGCIIMLIRNLNVRANLCNGTRLLVHHLGEHYIDAQIIQFDEQLSTQRVFIPRVDFVTSNTSTLPFILQRRQFPVRVSYCLTINKAQGQSFDAVGIYLPNAVFDHGQLYVAFSRARTMHQVYVTVIQNNQQGKRSANGQTYTKNIVFKEIL